MKKIQILGLALFAVFAFSAVAAAAAFAESEWLEDGAVIAVAKETLTTGKITLSNTLFGVKTEVECIGTFVGTAGPGKAGSVTDLLDSTGTVVGELPGHPIDCTVVNAGGCTNGSLAEVNVDNLNLATGLTWATVIELVGTKFFVNFPATAGYEIVCTGPLGKVETLCEGTVEKAELTNLATDVEGKFLGAASGETKCTVGEKGLITGSGLTFLENELTLAVS